MKGLAALLILPLVLTSPVSLRSKRQECGTAGLCGITCCVSIRITQSVTSSCPACLPPPSLDHSCPCPVPPPAQSPAPSCTPCPQFCPCEPVVLPVAPPAPLPAACSPCPPPPMCSPCAAASPAASPTTRLSGVIQIPFEVEIEPINTRACSPCPAVPQCTPCPSFNPLPPPPPPPAYLPVPPPQFLEPLCPPCAPGAPCDPCSPVLPSYYSLPPPPAAAPPVYIVQQAPSLPTACTPSCQPSCQPACQAQPAAIAMQYGQATLPCASDLCICTPGYVKCAEQTCCMRYRRNSSKKSRK